MFYFTTAPEAYDYGYVTTVATGIRSKIGRKLWRLIKSVDAARFESFQSPRYASGFHGCVQAESRDAQLHGFPSPEQVG